jgi:hypothetical protein
MGGYMKILSSLILVLLFFGLTGCAVRQADLTAMTTRNVKLDGTNLNALSGKRIEGKDSKFIFLFIPLGLPHIENAVDDALDKGKGDLILDAVIYTKGWWFLVGQNIITVKGTVVNTLESTTR